MARSKVLSAFSGLFHAPFNGLLILVWAFFVWCHLMNPQTAILHGLFADSDDAVHLVRVIEWLKGQDWFDPFLRRLAPPEGVAIHYSRLAELPLAAIIWPLHALGASWTMAAYVAAFVWPLVLLGFLLCALRWAAAPFLPSAWTRATAYVALFAVPLMMQFSPGRVDHHGLAALLTAMALGSAARVFRETERLRWGIGAGFFLALAQSVALETLPWLLLFSSFLGFYVVAEGKKADLSGLVYGLSLYVFSWLFLAIAVSPAAFYRINPLAYSYLYVLIAGGIALAFAALFLASFFGGLRLRALAGGAAAGLLLAGMAEVFPGFLRGPYGGMDPRLSEWILGFISEAKPLLRKAETAGVLLAGLLLPLLALAASVALTIKSGKKDRWIWGMQTALLAVALLLTVFYQTRVILYACLFAVIPLAALLREGLRLARASLKGRPLFLAELYLLLLVGPLAGVWIPGLTDARPFRDVAVLFPVVFQADKDCAAPGLWETLNAPGFYGDRPRLIMNTMNEGAMVLFRTPHSVMAAPYHTNVRGNLDSIAFFRAEDPKEAEKIARRGGAEMVLLCGKLSDIYKSKEKENPSFAEQLIAGKTPSWLKPVEMPFMGRALLFEVRK